MDCYDFLADSYDQLTTDVPYSQWADFIERQFQRQGIPGRTILDLACGTGSLTAELTRRGYEMIGVDRSPDMLAVAAEKCRDLPGEPPIFLNQSMEKLDLYGTMDACVCCLDSINYVTKPDNLRKAFQRVHLFLMPGGLFLFDVKTPEALQAADGQVYLDETEDTFCVWRGEYSAKRRILTYWMDLFRRTEHGLWRRGEEMHQEYAYTPEELEEFLQQAGFCNVRQWGCLKLRPPRPGEERIFFTAQKGKSGQRPLLIHRIRRGLGNIPEPVD